jgi:hypothetical protein
MVKHLSEPLLNRAVCVGINWFYPKTRAREGASKVLAQLAALALFVNSLLLSPILFIEVTRFPLYLETVHRTRVQTYRAPAQQSRGSDSVAKLAAATAYDSTYGSSALHSTDFCTLYYSVQKRGYY